MLKCGYCHAKVKWNDNICPCCGRLVINDREKQRIVLGGAALLLLAAGGIGLLIRWVTH